MASQSRSASSRGCLEHVKRQALRALGADAGQLLQLLDEPEREDRGATRRQNRPGIFSPPISPRIG